ncbi:hypothetical protein ACFLZV_04625 [Candidatus Margulisiibacteriota bacterium]
MNQNQAYIIGGPNGAGKSTFVEKYLPEYLEIKNFVNADNIASGLAPFNYQSQQIKAGKLIQNLKSDDYEIVVFFLDIESLPLAVSRVKSRVMMGGHDIPLETIIRRYSRARYNFWNTYRPVADKWYLFNNSMDKPNLIALNESNNTQVYNSKYFDFFISSIDKESKL